MNPLEAARKSYEALTQMQPDFKVFLESMKTMTGILSDKYGLPRNSSREELPRTIGASPLYSLVSSDDKAWNAKESVGRGFCISATTNPVLVNATGLDGVLFSVVVNSNGFSCDVRVKSIEVKASGNQYSLIVW